MNTAQRIATQATIETLTFGVEIETYGLGIEKAAKIVLAVLWAGHEGDAPSARHLGGHYDRTTARGPDGREWTSMSDGSIRGSNGAEVVSPILRGEADLLVLQSVVRALREAGAKSDSEHRCGVHVHVGVAHLDAAAIGRCAKSVESIDGFIRKSCGIDAERGRDWCCPLTTPTRQSGHVANLAALGSARTFGDLATAWYGSEYAAQDAATVHYHGSRYHALNLHSVFYAPGGRTPRGTVEFRYFDGTLHAGRIRAYVNLCRAIVARASVVRAASAAPVVVETARQATAVLAAGLGLTGPQFATTRAHLTAAWSPRAARRAA